MGSRRKISSFDSSELEEDYNDYEPERVTVSTAPQRIAIRSRIDSRYIVVGDKSGERYVFDGAGAEVKVLEEDVPQLLGLKRGKACCGGTSGTPIFEKVGG